MATDFDGDPAETESLGFFARRQNKYGSTSSKHVTRKENYLTHYVQPNDTLQGLALRYGASMEHIKRANKLWTADSLFLKKTLNIPVGDINDPVSPSSSNGTLSPNFSYDTSKPSSVGHDKDLSSSLECDDNISLNETDPISLKTKTVQSSGKNCLVSHRGSTSSIDISCEERDESAVDFLIRIDSNIAKSKNKVRTFIRNNKKDATNGDDMYKPRHDQKTSSWSASSSNSSLYKANGLNRCSGSMGNVGLNPYNSDINSDMAQPYVMTQGRKVKSSLKRLEQQADELFQL